MAKGLAEALMGEITLLRPHRGRVAGERAAVGPTSRAATSGAASAQRARLWRAGQGGHAAVLKKIHRGGTHTAGQLGNQLDYLFAKAAWCGGNIVDFDPRRKTLTPEERKDIVTAWSDDWSRSPRNGHTTHLLISLPQHVRPQVARAIAADWAAEMFESGAQGDEWSYVAALHTDRSHPHVHFVIQNRGVLNGAWFYMAKDHAFNLAFMKERMAAIAEEHGVRLETTSRIERGILSYGPGRGEIEAARREGRAVDEKPRMGEARRVALAEMKQVSGVYQDLAFLARMTEAKDAASRMAAASAALAAGRPFIPHQTENPMADATHEKITTRSDFDSYVKGWMADMSDKLARLSADDQREMRPEFNAVSARAMAALGDTRGAELAQETPRSDLYRTAIREEGVILAGAEAALNPAAASQLTHALTRAAGSAGLDADQIGKRLERGAVSALEERGWIKADVQAVAAGKGLDIDRQDHRSEAAGVVDRFYQKAGELIAEARGVKVETAADRLRQVLTSMTEVEARHGRVTFDREDAAKSLSDDMKTRYGETIIADLARGKTEALAADFADPAMRQKIARAVVAAAVEHEEIGLPLKDARAAQERMRDEAAHQRNLDRERSRDRDAGRER